MAYGFAEITHLCICHCILDGLMKGNLPESDMGNYQVTEMMEHEHH